MIIRELQHENANMTAEIIVTIYNFGKLFTLVVCTIRVIQMILKQHLFTPGSVFSLFITPFTAGGDAEGVGSVGCIMAV